MPYELVVLRPGSYKEAPGSRGGFNVACTITLLKGEHNILVDTGSPWDAKLLLDGLTQNGLDAKKIDFVIGTNGHVSRIGNLGMFTNATHVVCHDVCKDNVYFQHPFNENVPYEIDDDISVESTPGHTSQDISVFVQTASNGLVAVCGGLFESEHDLADPELWQNCSQFPEIQQKSRMEILKRADRIVPGHGPMFKIQESFKEDPHMVMIASDTEDNEPADEV